MSYEMIVQTLISNAEGSVTEDPDDSIHRVRECYFNIRNSYFASAEARMEQLLYRLYDAKHFIRPDMGIDVKQYVTDDEYFAASQPAITAAYDPERGGALYEEAVALIRKKDYAQAAVLFGQAARCGHAEAQYNYGVSHTQQEMPEADPLEGCYWYWKAAHQKEPRAMMNLAICYRNGVGVKENPGQMLSLYACAAKQLLPEAVYNMGLSLKHEEVFAGLKTLGLELTELAERMGEPGVADRIVSRADQVIGLLDKYCDVFVV